MSPEPETNALCHLLNQRMQLVGGQHSSLSVVGMSGFGKCLQLTPSKLRISLACSWWSILGGRDGVLAHSQLLQQAHKSFSPCLVLLDPIPAHALYQRQQVIIGSLVYLLAGSARNMLADFVMVTIWERRMPSACKAQPADLARSARLYTLHASACKTWTYCCHRTDQDESGCMEVMHASLAVQAKPAGSQLG